MADLTMIERVARAIHVAEEGCDFWGELPRAIQDNLRRIARAAIETMRDTPPALVWAAIDQIGDQYAVEIRSSFWRAMIDAALNEGAA